MAFHSLSLLIGVFVGGMNSTLSGQLEVSSMGKHDSFTQTSTFWNPSMGSYNRHGKSSIYEVHQFSSVVINSSPEIEYRSEKSILAVREYKHFQQ
jgi:hypothetical protein